MYRNEIRRYKIFGFCQTEFTGSLLTGFISGKAQITYSTLTANVIPQVAN